MPELLSRMARRSGLAALILAVALCAAGDGGAQKEPPLSPDAPAKGRVSTLCILVQVKNQDVTAKEIEETVTKGVRLLGYKSTQTRAVALRPETLVELQRLISTLEAPTTTGAEGKPIITQKASDARTEWEFNLNVNEQGVVLRKLELKIKAGDKEESKTYELNTVSKPEDPVVRTTMPGVFVIRLPANEVPVSFVAHYVSVMNRTERTLSGPWPAQQRCFLVTVRDFEGDSKKLLDTIRRVPGEKPQVANPFDDVEPGPDIAMVFATVGFKHFRSGVILDENKWVPVVQGIENTPSDRVWMLFPLTRDEVETKLKEYRKLAPGELSTKIRSENPRWAKDHPMITIDDNLKPTWVELPHAGEKGFSREFRIKDVRALQKALPDAYRLVVYEFGTPEDSSAQAVQDPVTKGRVFIVGEAIKEWPEGIKEAAKRAEKQPK